MLKFSIKKPILSFFISCFCVLFIFIFNVINGIGVTPTTAKAGNYNNKITVKTIVKKSNFIVNEPDKKILAVPYVSQYFKFGSSDTMNLGNYTCGAASSLEVVAYFNKVSYTKEEELQKYIADATYDGMPEVPKRCDNLNGVFRYTAYESGCNASLPANMLTFLRDSGISANIYSNKKNMFKIGEQAKDQLSLEDIKAEIDKGYPIITEYGGILNHIFVIVGYDKNGIIVHDSYTDMNQGDKPLEYDSGKNVIYPISDDGRTLFPESKKSGGLVYYITTSPS